MLGIIGEDSRMACDVISRTVNLASRLESLTKYYGCKLIISESTYNACCEGFLLRELDFVCVVGIPTPVRIYEVICKISDTTEELLELVKSYEQARENYSARQFEVAMKEFEVLKDKGDKPSAVMFNRCQYFLQNTPEDVWEDVWIFDHK